MSKPVPRRRLLRRLLTELRPYRRQVALIAGIDLLGTPLVLLTPVPVKIAVDSVIGGQPLPGFVEPLIPEALTRTDGRLLLVVAAMQVLVVVLAQVQEMGSYVLRVRTGEALVQRVRERLFGHAQRLSLRRHDTQGSTDSVYRIQYDASALQRLLIYGVLTTLSASITLVAMLVVIARLDWQLAVVGLAVSPLLVVLTRRYRVRVRPRYKDVKGVESDAMRIVQEALGAIRVVKAFGGEDGERDRFSQRSWTGVRARVGLAWAEGWFGLLVNLITGLGTAAVLFIGVRHVQSGALTLGELLMVIAYLSQLYAPLKAISRNAASLQSSLASVERVFEFLDEPPDVPQQPRPRALARASGRVEFVHVSMSYDGDQEVLRDVSFRVEPGTRVGISGVTGAGKTTLVNLLARFYDPTAGQVLLDGIDLREYRVADLRRQLAIVLQEPVLFSTSIAENIRYARTEASPDDVVAAARQAGAHEFIRRLPQGYDTLVGERGMRLSGGERQRISLARAFLKQGQVLILDEPTSSVDTRTEAEILAAMERLMVGRTSFLIAHRPSTLVGCHVRIELENGKVIIDPRVPRDGTTQPQVGAAGPVPASARPAMTTRSDVGQDLTTLEPLLSGLADGAGRSVEVVDSAELRRGVHRVELAGASRPRVVVKRMRSTKSRLERLVTDRWLPDARLDGLGPPRLAVLAEPDGGCVWHVYEDLGPWGLDRDDVDQESIEAAMRRVAELHARFARHAMLPEPRYAAGDLGAYFYTKSVRDAARSLERLRPPALELSDDEEEIRDRLLDQLRVLLDEERERVQLIGQAGPETLLHGDLMRANVFALPAVGAPTVRLIDWDHAGVGPAAFDISTHVSCYAPAQQRQVLDCYIAAMAERGFPFGDDVDWDRLLATFEAGRLANQIIWVAICILQRDGWDFEGLAQWSRSLAAALEGTVPAGGAP